MCIKYKYIMLYMKKNMCTQLLKGSHYIIEYEKHIHILKYICTLRNFYIINIHILNIWILYIYGINMYQLQYHYIWLYLYYKYPFQRKLIKIYTLNIIQKIMLCIYHIKSGKKKHYLLQFNVKLLSIQYVRIYNPEKKYINNII